MTLPEGWPRGYALRSLDVVDSTNEEARRLARAGESGPIWITAAKQSAGRGRRGRGWETPSGNLAASLLLHPDRSPGEAAQLSFVAALAASDMIGSFAREARVAVKWPNDVLIDDRKIAGILLESASTGRDDLEWLVVGIGVNLAHHPEGTEFPATSLAVAGGPVPSPADALLRLARDWARWYEEWRMHGFATVRDSWLARAAHLGKRIRARLQREEVEGVFEGIDEAGALILRQSRDNTRIIAAGDVFF